MILHASIKYPVQLLLHFKAFKVTFNTFTMFGCALPHCAVIRVHKFVTVLAMLLLLLKALEGIDMM